jgi:hypothetical protein
MKVNLTEELLTSLLSLLSYSMHGNLTQDIFFGKTGIANKLMYEIQFALAKLHL